MSTSFCTTAPSCPILRESLQLATTTRPRTVAIRQGETINPRALTAMFKHIVANNRAGGWRKLKGER